MTQHTLAKDENAQIQVNLTPESKLNGNSLHIRLNCGMLHQVENAIDKALVIRQSAMAASRSFSFGNHRNGSDHSFDMDLLCVRYQIIMFI